MRVLGALTRTTGEGLLHRWLLVRSVTRQVWFALWESLWRDSCNQGERLTSTAASHSASMRLTTAMRVTGLR